MISSRSEALSRFIGAYARLAKLPRPTLAPLDVAPWIRRVVGMETRLHVDVQPGPNLVIHGDADQLEQVLINLLRNATDAALETSGGVRVGWRKNASYVEINVEDDGPGLSNTGNLFVPFFTTKTRRLGDRPGAEPANRRSPRRRAHAREPARRLGLRGAAAIADLKVLLRNEPNFQ